MPVATSVVKRGSEFLVNTVTFADQILPKASGLTNGGFVVSWTDYSRQGGDDNLGGIKAQVFSAAGAKVGGELLVNTLTASYQQRSTVTGLSNGGFVVSWENGSGIDEDGSGTGIKAQVFSATGVKVGGEFLVNGVTTNDQLNPTITGLVDGGFVVSWMDYSGQGSDGYLGIKAQVFSATGARIGAEFLVNTATAGPQEQVKITGLSNGGFVASWMDQSGQGGDASGTGIKAQVFSATGTKIGGEFLVNTMTTANQQQPTIAGLSNGGFVVSWMDQSGQGGDASLSSVKAQLFSAGGVKIGGEFVVNTVTEGYQEQPTIAGLANGGFVVSWIDGSGQGGDTTPPAIKAQAFDATGQKIGGEMLANTVTSNTQHAPTITGLVDGGFVVSWIDGSGQGGDASGWSIKAQVFSVSNIGTSGDDRFTGLGGADTMIGGAGNDIYVVDHQGDIVQESGGEGTDTVETTLNNYTLAANVENLTITGTGAVNVNGNELANVITGNAGRNVVYAGAGNDVIRSGGGDDYLDGGTGADTFHGGAGNTQYVFDNAGDVVIGEVAGGGTDTIWSSVSVNLNNHGLIEILRLNGGGAIDGTGNALNNTMTGNAGSNVITGGAGIDTLYGKGGADIFAFAEMGAANKDSIWDFDADDKVMLDAQVFTGLGIDGDHLAAANFLKGAAAAIAGRATIIYTAWTGILSYDADGKGGAVAQEIAYIGKNMSFFDSGDILIG